MGIFDGIGFSELHQIPIGYKNGVVVYKTVYAIRIDLDDDLDGVFSLEFLESLPSYWRVQIGDTFYKKRGAEFVYDYLNGSGNESDSSYTRNLEPLIYEEIWIYREF